jgi:hypothetical protein
LAPTVGIAATGFCYPGGILQVFIDKISKFFIDKISKFFIDKISKFFIDKINKFCGYRQQQSDRISLNHHLQWPDQIWSVHLSICAQLRHRLPPSQLIFVKAIVKINRELQRFSSVRGGRSISFNGINNWKRNPSRV